MYIYVIVFPVLQAITVPQQRKKILSVSKFSNMYISLFMINFTVIYCIIVKFNAGIQTADYRNIIVHVDL